MLDLKKFSGSVAIEVVNKLPGAVAISMGISLSYNSITYK